MNSLKAIGEAVREARTVAIKGGGSKAAFGLPVSAEVELDMTAYAGIVAHEPADQVVTVRAGTSIAELQEELARHSLCLPMPSPAEHGVLLAGFPGTVGGLISVNLPHALFAQCGGPRDWVLGMTVVRGDGTIAKSGSRVVKSVAGFDVHKLFVGARGTLGVVADVTFRTFPVRALPAVVGVTRKTFHEGTPLCVKRTLHSAFRAAVEAAWGRLFAEDEASATLWAECEPGVGDVADSPRRHGGHGGPTEGITVNAHATQGAWTIRAGCGAANLDAPDEATAELMRKAKAALDPEGKFNRGAMGCV